MKRPLLSLVVLMVSCGGKSGGSRQPDPPTQDPTAPVEGPSGAGQDGNQYGRTGPGQTIVGSWEGVPDTYARELQAWLQQPQKSCDIHAIFSAFKTDKPQLAPAYDLTMLLTALDQKLQLTNAAGETLLLSKPFAPKESGSSHRSHASNGKTVKFSSELTLDGICTIHFDDRQLVSLPLMGGLGATAILKAQVLNPTTVKAVKDASVELQSEYTVLNVAGLG